MKIPNQSLEYFFFPKKYFNILHDNHVFNYALKHQPAIYTFREMKKNVPLNLMSCMHLNPNFNHPAQPFEPIKFPFHFSSWALIFLFGLLLSFFFLIYFFIFFYCF